MNFLGKQNANMYQMLNLVVETGSVFPRNYQNGQLFFRTDEDALYLRQSTSWKNIMSAPLTLIITANSRFKVDGITLTLYGTSFTSSGLLPGDSIASTTITSTGAAAGAPIGIYPIVISDAVGIGLEKYIIIYINGDLTVF